MKHLLIAQSKLEKLTLAEIHAIILKYREHDDKTQLLRELDINDIQTLCFYLYHLGNIIEQKPCYLFECERLTTEQVHARFGKYYYEINKIETPNPYEFTPREVYQLLEAKKGNILITAYQLGLSSRHALHILLRETGPKFKALKERKTEDEFKIICDTITLEEKNIKDYIVPRQINSRFEQPTIRYDMIAEDWQEQLLEEVERPASPDGLLPADWEQRSLEECITAVLKNGEAALLLQEPDNTKKSVLRALTHLTLFKQDGDISLTSPKRPPDDLSANPETKRRRLSPE